MDEPEQPGGSDVSDLTLTEVGKRIDAHLKRFERNPKLNPVTKGFGTHRFYMAGASRGGSRVSVRYVSYQGATSMTRDEALKYLAWLDAGNVGRHYEMENER